MRLYGIDDSGHAMPSRILQISFSLIAIGCVSLEACHTHWQGLPHPVAENVSSVAAY